MELQEPFTKKTVDIKSVFILWGTGRQICVVLQFKNNSQRRGALVGREPLSSSESEREDLGV
jgi:hypothetical protein